MDDEQTVFLYTLSLYIELYQQLADSSRRWTNGNQDKYSSTAAVQPLCRITYAPEECLIYDTSLLCLLHRATCGSPG